MPLYVRSFSRAHLVVTKYIGLFATVKRKDGLTKVIKWSLGVVFTKQRKGENKVLVKGITYESIDEEFDKDVWLWGQIKYTSMIKNYVNLL